MKDAPFQIRPCAGLRWSGCTDRGTTKPNNEDAFIGLQFDSREIYHLGKIGESRGDAMDCVFAVSDGMGGANAGEHASRVAVQKMTTMLPRAYRRAATGLGGAGVGDVLEDLFTEVNRALAYLGESDEDCRGMQTTLSLCWFQPGRMWFGHIGDSRIYYLPVRTGELRQLTHDDTHVGWLFRNGQINEREARQHPRRHALQKALGAGNQFAVPQIGAVTCEPGDIFLLCTDGLVDGLYDRHLEEYLRHPASTAPDARPAEQLVADSLAQSGRDNTTALVVRVL